MSTKIFVHRQRKLKPAKPPDPDLNRLFAEAIERREHEKTRREQNRLVMAELRNEELSKRAAKLAPPLPPRAEMYHCRYCWGMQTAADLLGSQNKIMDRFYRAVVYDRRELLDDPWLMRVEQGLGDALQKAAKWKNVPLDDDEIAKISVRTCKRSLEALEDLQEDRRRQREMLANMNFVGEALEPGRPTRGGTSITHRLVIEATKGDFACVREEITK